MIHGDTVLMHDRPYVIMYDTSIRCANGPNIRLTPLGSPQDSGMDRGELTDSER